MSRNGSGVYSLPTVYEAVPGETIEATQHNAPLEDIAQDLNTARPIVAGGTGGTSAQAAIDNILSGGTVGNLTVRLLTAGGGANALTVTPAPAFTLLATGQAVFFKAAATNTATTSLNVNALGAKTIFAAGGAIGAGEIVAGGHYLATYDASANSGAGAWMLQNATGLRLAGNQTVAGLKTFSEYTMHRAGARATASGAGATNPGAVASVGATMSPDGFFSAYAPDARACDIGRGTDGPVLRAWRGTTNVGSISVTAAATAFNTSSDESLKDFIGEYDPDAAIAIIRADPVRDWNWIAAYGGGYAIGWGAQTSYTISSDLASPGVGSPGDEGFVPWGVDQGKRTPYLWAAMTRVLDKLDAIEARLDELEAS